MFKLGRMTSTGWRVTAKRARANGHVRRLRWMHGAPTVSEEADDPAEYNGAEPRYPRRHVVIERRADGELLTDAEGNYVPRRRTVRWLGRRQREQLPLVPGPGLQYLGRDSDLPFGMPPGRVDAPDATAAYILADKEHLDPVRAHCTVKTGPMWLTARAEFQGFCGNRDYEGDFEDVFSVLDVLDTRCPRIEFAPSADDLESMTINGDAHPGIRSKGMFGYRNKREAAGFSVDVARSRIEECGRKPRGYADLWVPGGRDRKQRLDEGSVMRSRSVWIDECYASLMARLYMRPIMSAISGDREHAIYIGYTGVRQGYKRLERDFSNGVVLEGDWKRFDQNVREQQVIAAFGWMRACYPAGRRLDNIFVSLCANFLYRNLVTPGGHVYFSQGGVPSGSGWTSLVDSVINYLTLSGAILERCGPQALVDARFAIGGDDFGVCQNKVNFVTPEEIGEYAERKWRWKLDPDSTRMGPLWRLDDTQDFFTFYGEGLWNGLPSRKKDRVMDNLLQPAYPMDSEGYRNGTSCRSLESRHVTLGPMKCSRTCTTRTMITLSRRGSNRSNTGPSVLRRSGAKRHGWAAVSHARSLLKR
jgi:hypothetical protein